MGSVANRAPPSERARARLERLAGRHVPAALRWWARVAIQTLRRWRVDRCPQEAAALAFKTTLGLVPLCAVAFTLLQASGKLQERSALFEFFAENLFPSHESREAVQSALISFADKISSGVLGPGGIALLILIGYLLYLDIEGFWARVWSSARRRSILRSFATFYLLATLVPFLVAISLYHTARFWRGGWVGLLAPGASTFLALLAANRLLPSVRVQFKYAAVGAGLSTVLLEAAKLAFARYVLAVLTKYHSIYGALGLLPLLLVWIYVGWMVVLLGAELAHAAQRLEALEAASDRRRGADDAWELATGSTAARLMVEIARHYTAGRGALGVGALAERLRVPEEVVQRVAGRLKERGLAVEVEGDVTGWLPARPPSAIRLDEVLAVFRVRGAAGGDRLGELLDELEPSESERARVTLDQLAADSTS